MLHQQLKSFQNPELRLSESDIKNLTLVEIEKLLKQQSKSLRDYESMPFPDNDGSGIGHSRLISDELNYDRKALTLEHDRLISNMTDEQKEAANSGSLIGHPVENICIVLNDGAAHTVDSSELAFKLAAIYAFRQTFLLEGPRPRWRFQRVIQEKYSYLIDEKRVFYSDIKNDNPLSCTDNEDGSSMSDGLIRTKFSDVAKHRQDIGRTNGTLLDLYSGCGAMSSGLCIGASLDGVTVTTWAYVVDKILDICYGDPNKKESGLYFKSGLFSRYVGKATKKRMTHGLGNCKEKMKEFVSQVHEAKAIPLPDEKNHGQLTRYAVGRLVSMDYQARLGIMATGAYGVPQCRMRFFLWGATPTERFPQFPLPTHKTLKKGVVINEFKECIVGHQNENAELLEPVLLGEVISDLPSKVTNDSTMDQMPYDSTIN
ncbi:hypothetical protein CASFOL_028391 [Castilleja foliolosa]|uniref:DNA (cytosine-5-)-methyltransferase n=1 Tax=Castilleja foliolosa TaxID=1961234 RepID=A0ABD3CAZ9_9LAMI